MLARTRIAIVTTALAAAALGAAPAPASIATGARYLEGRLDGSGCAAEPGRGGSVALSGWVAIGLAGGARPASTPAGCVAAAASRLRSATDVELAILALVAAGEDPSDADGVDLVARLRRQIRASGAIGPTGNSTIFGVLALRGASSSIPARVVRHLRAIQRGDGSFSWSAGVSPDSNMTAAGIQALRAAGLARTSRPVRRAVVALRRFRTASGGFGQRRGDRPDAQSTAWALQALAAAGTGSGPARTWLLARQRRNGSFEYAPGRVVTPVWVTAMALPALAGRPLPLRG